MQVLEDLNGARADLIRRASELSQLRAANTRLLSELDQLSDECKREKERLVEEHLVSLERATQQAAQQSQVN